MILKLVESVINIKHAALWGAGLGPGTTGTPAAPGPAPSSPRGPGPLFLLSFATTGL